MVRPSEYDPEKPNIPIHLHNVSCPFCGISINENNKTTEHVIGRKFVPKGSLENTFNLILYACKNCNNLKADLEDDISAITQLCSPNKTILPEHRKNKAAKSLSRLTNRSVKDSNEDISVSGSLGPQIEMNFGLISPPQIDHRRAYELARLHAMAFFYLLTYNEDENKGYWWNGDLAGIECVNHQDWGNHRSKMFMDLTHDWISGITQITAQNNFKISIKKSPETNLLAIVLEWNQSRYASRRRRVCAN